MRDIFSTFAVHLGSSISDITPFLQVRSLCICNCSPSAGSIARIELVRYAQVSIYGHSLGSVLSYDILCHQKDLTSLFPIIEVRPEIEANGVEGSSCSDGVISENGESLTAKISSSKDHSMKVEENSGEIDLCSDGAKSEDGEISEEEIPSSPAGDVAETEPSSSGEIDGCDQCAEQEKLQSSGDHPAHEPNENVSQDHDQSVAATHAQKVDALVNDSKEVSESELEALREEVKLLREKLAALAAEQGPVKDLRALPTVPLDSSGASASSEICETEESEGEDISCTGDDTGHCDDGPHVSETNDYSDDTRPSHDPAEANNLKDDAGPSRLESKISSRKHYTPYISYTKLNFKVDTFYAVGSPLGVSYHSGIYVSG